MLTKKETFSCIKLLHQDYHHFDIEVIKTKWRLIGWFLHKPKRDKFEVLLFGIRNMLHGSFDTNSRKILMFPFSFKQYYKDFQSKDEVKILYLWTLFHELRHYYQEKHPRLLKKYVERDANRFATRMCNKHMNKINKILNINFSWEVRK